MNTSLRPPELCQIFLSYVLIMISSHLNLPQLQSKQLAYAVCSVLSDSLQPPGLSSTRLLCPQNFPGKNTGVGCHFLLQRIFPIQGSNHLSYVSCIAGGFFTTESPGKPKQRAKDNDSA